MEWIWGKSEKKKKSKEKRRPAREWWKVEYCDELQPPLISSSSLGFSPAVEPMFSRIGEGHLEPIHKEPELFEDTCYVPHPVSLPGPVSELLDNIQLDIRTSFLIDVGSESPRTLKNTSASSDLNKSSPIESPLSQEKHDNCDRSKSTKGPGSAFSIPR